MPPRRLGLIAAATVAVCALGFVAARTYLSPSGAPTFDSPEAAATALATAVASGSMEDVRALFGPESESLFDTDPIVVKRNREVFQVAMAEGWRVVDDGERKTLVVGNEAWPFPVPLVRSGAKWRFDAAAGMEEIVARRIGRNELAAIRVCRTYVVAQQLYARRAHDGAPAGRYAAVFRSDAGRENGLYWPPTPGGPRSPLGELLVAAAADSRSKGGDGKPQPFYGYYFRILTAQGAAAPGGARDYLVDGALSGGFALVAWPAEYDVTGVMTFIVNQEGLVYEQDLGPDGDATARALTAYDPDESWTLVE